MMIPACPSPSLATMLRTLARCFAVGAALVMTTGCGVEVGASYPGIDVGFPPDAIVATTEPVYFDGHASYLYGGRWYYRDGNRWSHYDHEPPALAQRRVQAPPRQRTYEPRRVARPAVARGAVHR
jgi:hypothetical protein